MFIRDQKNAYRICFDHSIAIARLVFVVASLSSTSSMAAVNGYGSYDAPQKQSKMRNVVICKKSVDMLVTAIPSYTDLSD